MLFATGSVVVLGCKSQEELEQVVSLVTKDLSCSLDKPVAIRNVAGSASYRGLIDLPALHAHVRDVERLARKYKACLEPELFPALIISNIERSSEHPSTKPSKSPPNMKALVYHSGKIIVTGAKSFNECRLLSSKIEDIIVEKHLNCIFE